MFKPRNVGSFVISFVYCGLLVVLLTGLLPQIIDIYTYTERDTIVYTILSGAFILMPLIWSKARNILWRI